MITLFGVSVGYFSVRKKEVAANLSDALAWARARGVRCKYYNIMNMRIRGS